MSELKERASAHEEHFPTSTVDFVKVLDETYPHLCIREGQDEISAHRYAAIRTFIDELMALCDEHINGDPYD
jgi:hypothetical protein